MLNLTKNCEASAILSSPRPYFEKGIFWKEEYNFHGKAKAEKVAGLF